MDKSRIRLLDAEALWTYALKVLGGRAYSSSEMREKLRRRAERAADVEDVLARLKEHRYLDDRRFAEGFAAARLANEKHGRVRVLQDLRHHRIAPSLAERTVKEVYRDTDERALIEDWIRRKYRLAPREGLFAEDKDLAAAYRRLLRAGFRSPEILNVLKLYAKNPGLVDSFEPPPEE